jgi:hypothetical protein
MLWIVGIPPDWTNFDPRAGMLLRVWKQMLGDVTRRSSIISWIRIDCWRKTVCLAVKYDGYSLGCSQAREVQSGALGLSGVPEATLVFLSETLTWNINSYCLFNVEPLTWKCQLLQVCAFHELHSIPYSRLSSGEENGFGSYIIIISFNMKLRRIVLVFLFLVLHQ